MTGRCDGAGDPATDIGDVDEAPGPAQQLTVNEEGFPEVHIREMGAHAPRRFRVVGNENVTFPNVITERGNGTFHGHANHHEHAIAPRSRKYFPGTRHQH